MRSTLAAFLSVVFAACASPPPAAPTPTATAPRQIARAIIFFVVSGPTELYLAPERHEIPVEDGTPVPVAVVRALVASAPQDPDHVAPLPSATTVHDVAVSDGTATVDFSAEVLENPGAGARGELLSIQAVVWTLARLDGIERVRFTVEGAAQGPAPGGRQIEDWWGHVGLSGQPFEPAPAVIAPLVLWTPRHDDQAAGRIVVEGEVFADADQVGAILAPDDDPSAAVAGDIRTDATPTLPGAAGAFRGELAFAAERPDQTYTLRVFLRDEAGEIAFVEDRMIRARPPDRTGPPRPESP